jgi:hypothetical protein
MNGLDAYCTFYFNLIFCVKYYSWTVSYEVYFLWSHFSALKWEWFLKNPVVISILFMMYCYNYTPIEIDGCWDCCICYRVDVHRKDNVGSLEKAITIYGNPDNCTNACRRILEVMQQEANNTNKGYLFYKFLASWFCFSVTHECVCMWL